MLQLLRNSNNLGEAAGPMFVINTRICNVHMYTKTNTNSINIKTNNVGRKRNNQQKMNLINQINRKQ